MLEDKEEEEAPDFIERIDISLLSNDEIDKQLEAIRERRIRPVQLYLESQDLKDAARKADCLEILEKQLNMFAKEKDRMDALLDKMEQRALKIRAIRLEIDG